MQANSLNKNKGSFLGNKISTLPPVIWILVAMLLFFTFTTDNYLSFDNIINILKQSVPLMILAFAQTLIVLTQGTDLSLGAQVSIVTVLWVFLAQLGVPIYLGAVIAVMASVAAGTINGILVSKCKMPPFIATFGMQNILTSISLLITAGSSIYFYHEIFTYVYESAFLIIPVPVWIAIIVFGITWIILNKTKFGTSIFALGGNIEALHLAGVNTNKSYIKTYAYAGLLAGITGLITTCRVESGQPIVGIGWEFEAVAATLLGGTSLREGNGGIGGTIFGVLMLTMLRNGLNISGISAMYQSAIIGLIVMLAIVMDTLVRRARNRKG